MKKKLLILADFVCYDELYKYCRDSKDILALSPNAMSCLDEYKINYKTVDNFYPVDIFRKDLKVLHQAVEKTFIDLDDTCKQFIDFPCVYTGNILYFLRMFANLFYFENIAEKISANYEKIFIYSDIAPKELSWESLSYSDLRSIPQTKGLENKVQVLRYLLPAENIILNEAKKIQPSQFSKTKLILNRFSEKVTFGIWANRFSNAGGWVPRGRKKDTLFIIQDNYEVGALKKYLSGFRCIYPAVMLRKEVPLSSAAVYDFSRVDSCLNSFLEGRFKKMRYPIKALFLSYHREIMGRLGIFKARFEDLMDKYSPKTLLFSVGTRDVVDSLFAHVANQKNVQVIYFQHSGPPIFIKNILLKYMERDPNVRKTLALYSKVEKDEALHDGSECFVFGSIRRYELIKKDYNRKNNKALYCCSPFSFYNYTSLLFKESDVCRHLMVKEILRGVKDAQVALDVKLHPVEEARCFLYMKNLIKTIGSFKTKIFQGISIELIMKNYGMIILDSLDTGVVSLALSLKAVVVLYIKDRSVINPRVIEDLKKRCYVVSDKSELDDVLAKYAKGQLPSKWFEDIIDKYVYPLDGGDPGERIADYIKSICSK